MSEGGAGLPIGRWRLSPNFGGIFGNRRRKSPPTVKINHPPNRFLCKFFAAGIIQRNCLFLPETPQTTQPRGETCGPRPVDPDAVFAALVISERAYPLNARRRFVIVTDRNFFGSQFFGDYQWQL